MRSSKLQMTPPAAAGGKRAAALSRALKLHGIGRGRGSKFTEYRRYFPEITIALEIYEEVKDYEGVEDYPIENAAKKYEISPSTARRIYKKHSKTFLPR